MNYDSYVTLGRTLSTEDNLEQAIVAYEQAIALNPQRPGAYGFLGNIQLKQGNSEQAIKNYYQSIALRAKQPIEVYEKLSNALKAQGKIEEAKLIYQQGKQLGILPSNHQTKPQGIIAQSEINLIHRQFWRRGYGSVSADEAGFIQDSILATKPKRVLEIGTASGLSTGFIAKFMSNLGAGELISVDLDTHFWVDRTKETGFLAQEIYTGEEVKVNIFRGQDSTHLPETYHEHKFDLAFIDANHHHPWPILDMISVLPILNPQARVIHHDLALYQWQKPVLGIGPKYLYDQFPDQFKVVTNDPRKNIFYIKTTENYLDFVQFIINSLYLPWTIRQPISALTINKFKAIINTYWSEDLLEIFEKCVKKFN
jgi:tetratricopeptide (TPR) repeat protein